MPFIRVSYFGIEDMAPALYDSRDSSAMIRPSCSGRRTLVREEIDAIYARTAALPAKARRQKSGDLRRRRV